MSSSQSLREFIRERLTAAAAEIFSEFEQTIVRYEEEIDRQRRLLEISWKPQINLHRIACPEPPQHHVWVKEKVLTDQQLSNQERTSSLDQKEPEPPLIKAEHQELCMHRHEGQFIVKQENVTSMATSPSEVTDCCEPEPDRNQPLCQSSTEAENQDQDGCRNENAESNSQEELTQNKRRQQTRDPRDGVDGQKLKRYKWAHQDERSFSCKICGKSFCYKSVLSRHMRTHTGERPFRCETCGKCFFQRAHLASHMATHTGQKPFPCRICGKCFSRRFYLIYHMRTHTGEKPYACKSCGKGFAVKCNLTKHTRTHTVEKPYT